MYDGWYMYHRLGTHALTDGGVYIGSPSADVFAAARLNAAAAVA